MRGSAPRQSFARHGFNFARENFMQSSTLQHNKLRTWAAACRAALLVYTPQELLTMWAPMRVQ